MADNEVRMMMSVVPGAMTGFAALNAGLVSINNVFGAMTRSIDAQFGLIDTAIMTTGVVVTQLGLDAMDAFGKFEQGMKIVQMVSGQTSQEISYLGQKANEFSVQYRMDIDQITEGLQTLGRAGLNSASEQAEVLENGLYTAKLEGRDLNAVLEELIQTTALLGGDLKSPDFGEQSGYVEDLMVATSMTAPITTHDVNETLKYSGGIAAAAGANIETEEGKKILEDYMGAIAAFAQKGVTGSIAGTALRAFFNKPATQDSSVKEALATIKLKPEYLWEEDEETMKPVSEQIGLIQSQMDKLHISTMDRLQIWSKIVGGKMGQQMMKLDSDSIKEITSDIRAADAASTLASASMKTYEANVKALGEAGSLIERNVGSKLVFFANPILELIDKIASFLTNDFLSWPLALGIISFIGLAGRKAMGVIKALKAEISTLYSGMKAQQQFFTQKQGVVKVGSNPLDDYKEKAKAWFAAKEEYYGKKPDSDKGEKKTGKTSKPINEMTPQEFQKALWKQQSQPTVSELRKAGWSDTEIGLSGRMATLKKDSFGIGMSDAQFANFLGRHHILSDAQQTEVKKLLSTTAGARGPFNQLFMNENGKVRADIAEQIRKNEAAMKELGWTIQQETPAIENNAKAHAELTFKWEEESNKKQVIAQKELKTEDEKNTAILEKNTTKNAKLVQQEDTKDTELLEKNTTKNAKLVQQEEIKNAEVLKVVTAGSEEVVSQVATAVMQATNVAKAIGGTSGVKTIPNTAPSIVENFGKNPMIDGLNYRDYVFLKGMGYRFNPPEEKPVPKKSPTKYTPSYPKKDDPQAEYYNKYAEENKYNNLGKKTSEGPSKNGKYGDSILSSKEQDAVAKKLGIGKYAPETPKPVIMPGPRSGPENVNLGSGLQARLKAEEEAEKQTKKNLSNVKHGYEEAELKAQQQGLAVEEEILIARRQGADAVSATKSQQALSTEKDRQKFQNDRTSNLITSRKDINDINKQSKDLYNKNQRALSTEKDRQRFQNDRTNSNLITSRKEIDKLRSASSDTVKHSLRVYNAQQKLLKIQEAGGAREYNRKIRMSQPVPAADNEFYKSQKYSGWGTNQAVSYYNLSQNQLKDIAMAEYNDLNKTRKLNLSQYGFMSSFSSRINRDRTGSLLSFGAEFKDPNKPSAGIRSATSGLKGLANKALNLSDAFGGPLMIAIMAITTAIQLWQKMFQDYCEALKEATNQLQEAYSKWNSAEDNLRNTFKEGNPDATSEEIDQMVYDTYGTMNDDMANAFNNGMEEWFKKVDVSAEKGTELEYDEEKADGTTKEKEAEELSSEEEYTNAIKQNTGALYAATAELNVALSKFVTKANDGMWGLDGWTGAITDSFGSFEDYIVTNGGSNFTDSNEFLLTASQKDENYAGYTEMAGLMLEDIKDAGDWASGMQIMMGSDANNLVQTLPEETKQAMKGMEKDILALSPANNTRLQASMKNDQKTWKNLGKELSKRDSNQKFNRDISKNTSRINSLVAKLNASMGGNFSKTQILQAAYLQQMQDMYAVTQSSIIPIIQTNMQLAGSTLLQASGISGNTQGTGTSTFNTYSTATVIAGLVAQIARSTAADTAYNTALSADPGTKEDASDATDINMDGRSDEVDRAIIQLAQRDDIKSGQDFLKEASKLYSQSTKAPETDSHLYFGNYDTGISIPGTKQANQYINEETENTRKQGAAAMMFYEAMYGAGSKMTGWGYSADAAFKSSWKTVNDSWERGLSSNDVINTFAKNYTLNDSFKQKIIDAYNLAEDDEGTGNNTGSGDSGDTGNNNTGTKKERVDLVLCNKKEIPKLNVNLFKKPPTFTVLNKNFKLRDVKINTEDSPKAIMSSIKNAFIDVQKRNDPKIIQDEEGVYDPVGATEGNALPSGTAKTRTE